MRRELNIPDNLFIEHGKAIEEILRRAVRAALLDHKRAGNPVAVWQDDRVVTLSPAEIPVEEDSNGQEAT
jgi:hypothetical protein